MRSSMLVGVVMLVAASAVATAQTPAPAPAQSDIRATQKIAKRAAWKEKRVECRQDGVAKGLSRIDLRNHVKICVTEAKLTCFKQAAEQKLRGPDRREFIIRCADTV